MELAYSMGHDGDAVKRGLPIEKHRVTISHVTFHDVANLSQT